MSRISRAIVVSCWQFETLEGKYFPGDIQLLLSDDPKVCSHLTCVSCHVLKPSPILKPFFQLSKKRSADDMDMGATRRRDDRKVRCGSIFLLSLTSAVHTQTPCVYPRAFLSAPHRLHRKYSIWVRYVFLVRKEVNTGKEISLDFVPPLISLRLHVAQETNHWYRTCTQSSRARHRGLVAVKFAGSERPALSCPHGLNSKYSDGFESIDWSCFFSPDQLSELVDKLRQRVSSAEEQLKGVKAENQRLRQDKVRGTRLR